MYFEKKTKNLFVLDVFIAITAKLKERFIKGEEGKKQEEEKRASE